MAFSIRQSNNDKYDNACKRIERLIKAGLVTHGVLAIKTIPYEYSSNDLHITLDSMQVVHLSLTGNSKQRRQLRKKWMRSLKTEVSDTMMKHLVGAL